MLKINTIKQIITPEIGTRLAGYPRNSVSYKVHDDLLVSGIAFDDGNNKAVVLSFDLIGLDEDLINQIRQECGIICGIDPEDIVLTCTHTHSGPYTTRDEGLARNEDYIEKLIDYCREAVKGAFEEMIEVYVFHYSVNAYENLNRRLISPANTYLYLPDNKHLLKTAEGIVDPELGILYFMNAESKDAEAVFVNYTAHPLTSQSGGLSSSIITSDYPGILREHVENEIGGVCVFTQGACGDIHPREFESGFTRTEEMGKNLAKKVIHGYYAVTGYFSSEPETQYRLTDPTIQVHSIRFDMFSGDKQQGENLSPEAEKSILSTKLQFLQIGEVCLVGVPGELLVEPGLEIKWHSPYRKTFILYNSTAYLGYIAHTNAFISGGYESSSSHFNKYSAFNLVSNAVQGLIEISEKDN